MMSRPVFPKIFFTSQGPSTDPFSARGSMVRFLVPAASGRPGVSSLAHFGSRDDNIGTPYIESYCSAGTVLSGGIGADGHWDGFPFLAVFLSIYVLVSAVSKVSVGQIKAS